MKAMGAGRLAVFRLVWLETLMSTLAGGLLGWSWHLARAGLWRSCGMLPHIPADFTIGFTAETFWVCIGVSVALGVLAGTYPAWRAASISIGHSMVRHEQWVNTSFRHAPWRRPIPWASARWMLYEGSTCRDAGSLPACSGPPGRARRRHHLVGCLDLPTSGELSVAGQAISGNGARPRETALDLLRRRSIGFIFADFNLLPTLTAMENVQVPLIWRDEKAPHRARELLERVGLGHRLTHRPDELSGGEMQRVAVARALINQPDLLLADEPTANLDTRTRDEILELLAELSTEGVAVLLATHDNELADRTDTVLRIADGVIADD